MKYGPEFTQSLGASQYDSLPEFATYEGSAADLQHLVGLEIPTRDIEKVVYVGERENVWVLRDDGSRVRPWLGCWITEHNPDGSIVLDKQGGPLPVYGPRAMSTADLSSQGLTDGQLAAMAKDMLSVNYTPDRVGPSDLRREIYDAVMAKAYD